MEQLVADMAAQLRDLVTLDELTGLRNRRGFAEMATPVLERTAKAGPAICCSSTSTT